MAKVESLEGVGVFLLAIALLVAFTLKMSVPAPEVLRAQSQSHRVAFSAEIEVPAAR